MARMSRQTFHRLSRTAWAVSGSFSSCKRPGGVLSKASSAGLSRGSAQQSLTTIGQLSRSATIFLKNRGSVSAAHQRLQRLLKPYNCIYTFKAYPPKAYSSCSAAPQGSVHEKPPRYCLVSLIWNCRGHQEMICACKPRAAKTTLLAISVQR